MRGVGNTISPEHASNLDRKQESSRSLISPWVLGGNCLLMSFLLSFHLPFSKEESRVQGKETESDP